ncbi:MAG: hypothetical protein ACOWWM_15410 [Desulfobacterales bacterium]
MKTIITVLASVILILGCAHNPKEPTPLELLQQRNLKNQADLRVLIEDAKSLRADMDLHVINEREIIDSLNDDQLTQYIQLKKSDSMAEAELAARQLKSTLDDETINLIAQWMNEEENLASRAEFIQERARKIDSERANILKLAQILANQLNAERIASAQDSNSWYQNYQNNQNTQQLRNMNNTLNQINTNLMQMRNRRVISYP